MAPTSNGETSGVLEGKRVAFAGRLVSMSRREAARLVREHGAVVVEKPDASVQLVVVGEEGLPLIEAGGPEEPFDAEVRQAADQGTLAIISETELWGRLGLVESQQDVRRLYTPAMLADLLGVPTAIVRRWHRRGLIQPVREVRKLPYFDFQEVAAARRLAELLAAGTSPRAIERKLEALARYLPGVRRPLAQLSVIIEGREILLRQGDGLVEPGGQMRFDFQAAEAVEAPPGQAEGVAAAAETIVSLADRRQPKASPASPEQICRMAAELEDRGELEASAEMYRAAMAAGGPMPEICFRVAELLYRLGDLGGARERYFMSIELDEDYVEARVNLGCVLADLGQDEMAAAAFEGALAFHPDYPDAHYHLARALDELGRSDQAESHWQAFLDLAPESPWANAARNRLAGELPS
jgi:tetratricopeptide (TPR) repeat protein